MSRMPEVPTSDFLSFHEFPATHTTNTNVDIFPEIHISNEISNTLHMDDAEHEEPLYNDDMQSQNASKSFWSIEYYQQFFDVDTKDVSDRILASILPRKENLLKNDIRRKPDMYGPLWISVTLVFTIAISGNIANCLQHANNTQYHWKYNFHLVSYAATSIYAYIIIVPLSLWGLLKWSSEVNDLEMLEENKIPNALQLICIYGYSLFIYIPVSVLWCIQINWLQWLLLIAAAFLSGSVLLFTLLPSIRLSKFKLFVIIGIIVCHVLLAAGFMLYFFHIPDINVISTVPVLKNNTQGIKKE